MTNGTEHPGWARDASQWRRILLTLELRDRRDATSPRHRGAQPGQARDSTNSSIRIRTGRPSRNGRLLHHAIRRYLADHQRFADASLEKRLRLAQGTSPSDAARSPRIDGMMQNVQRYDCSPSLIAEVEA